MPDALVLLSLLAASALLILVERAGVRMTLELSFRGDLRRESQWLAQYGQFVCTFFIAGGMFCLRPNPWPATLALWGAFGAAAGGAGIVKRLTGRVRPRLHLGWMRPGAFVGPTWKHAGWRESFPSSHTACAVAVSAVMAHLYPAAAIVFWGLAGSCAFLRYATDSHWASDVLAGAAVGFGCAWAALEIAGLRG